MDTRRNFLKNTAELAGVVALPQVSSNLQGTPNHTSPQTAENYAFRHLYKAEHLFCDVPEENLAILLDHPHPSIEWLDHVGVYTRNAVTNAHQKGYLPEKLRKELIPLFQRSLIAVEQFSAQNPEEKECQERWAHLIELRIHRVNGYADTYWNTERVINDPEYQAKKQKYFPEPELTEEEKARLEEKEKKEWIEFDKRSCAQRWRRNKVIEKRCAAGEKIDPYNPNLTNEELDYVFEDDPFMSRLNCLSPT